MNIVFLDGYTINPGDLSWAQIEQFGALTVYDRTPENEVLSRAKDAEVMIVNKTKLDASHFSQLPHLRLVCVAATGYDRIDVKAAAEHGIVVCNCAGYSSRSVAQLVASFVLHVADSVSEYAEENRKGLWSKCPDFCYTLRNRLELVGKSFAVVGYGNIGETVINVLRPFGLKLYAVTSKAQNELPEDVHKITIQDAVSFCSFVSLHCPLTAENKEFVDAKLLKDSNPNLVLINTARGGLINEKDVADCLKSGNLAAYCTDVLSQEPPTEDCPILSAPNAYVTPHIGWDTPEARQRIIDILEDNIRNFMAGTPTSRVN